VFGLNLFDYLKPGVIAHSVRVPDRRDGRQVPLLIALLVADAGEQFDQRVDLDLTAARDQKLNQLDRAAGADRFEASRVHQRERRASGGLVDLLHGVPSFLKFAAECAVVLVEGHPFPAPHMLVATIGFIIAVAVNRSQAGDAQVTVES
jgi:hypothetical protein